MNYDVVIVGGGTAGCVLARRLSEGTAQRILLLEAGPDFPDRLTTPKSILDAKLPPMSHDWGYTAADGRNGDDAVVIPRGKIIGGSSSTNYGFAMRTRPADHDEWASLGLEGWGFEDVLPLYRDMERDDQGEDIWHGRDGLFHVERPAWEEVASTVRGFAEACMDLNIPVVEDINNPETTGFGIVPRNVIDGVRMSLAQSYLNPVRDRENLEVRGEVKVDRVLIEDGRAVGVKLSTGETIRASRVILSAGAFDSPAILMRSGIGASDELEALGIESTHELIGVGKNLMEHPVFWNIYSAKPTDEKPATIFQSCLSIKSHEGEQDYDLHLIPSSIMPASDIPPQYVPPTNEPHPSGFDFVVFVSNMRPQSRGYVALASKDPEASPLIFQNLYGIESDADVVAEGVELARRLVAQSAMADLVLEERAPGANVHGQELVAAVKRAATHYNHPCGTCKMGLPEDPLAVVDASGAVHGIEGLHVIDASIIPVLPRVAINPTTVLIAEKLGREYVASQLTPNRTQ